MQSSPRCRRVLAQAAALLRGMVIALCCAGLLAICCAQTARALNLYQDIFMTLSARPLAMGGCGAALDGPASVFYNPAGLAGIRSLKLMHNHSGRHFPGSYEARGKEMDQLDGDTQCVAVPVGIGTYAHGFTFSGELGYDYRNHPYPDSSFDNEGQKITAKLGYPHEHYDGREDYDAFALNLGLPCAFGYSNRRSIGRFDPAADSVQKLPWLRTGEGQQWGLQARVWPGLTYGRSELKLDYDWTLLALPGQGLPPGYANLGGLEAQADGSVSASGFPTMSSRVKERRSGWAFRPVGWLTLTSDELEENYIFRGDQGLGLMHEGDQSRGSSHRGAELSLGQLARWRWGSYDGRPTVGAALNLGGLWLNYSEVQDLLPSIVGSGRDYADVHIYGAEL